MDFTPDYSEYMEEYITAIEKTVMGNVLNVINNETSTQ